jgi:hypothetical protein
MATNNSVDVVLKGSTGSGTFVGSNSPTLVTPILGAASATSISFSSTSGIIGVTDSTNAATGSVGEFVNSNVLLASAISLTTATSANITSISLTAGDWDVFGNVGCTGNAATLVQSIAGWVSSTSATAPDASLICGPSLGTTGVAIFAQTYYCFSVFQQRFSLAGTTTIYLSVNSTFSVNSCSAFGTISARRRR